VPRRENRAAKRTHFRIKKVLIFWERCCDYAGCVRRDE